MANEIIKKTERFILVQIDKEGTEPFCIKIL